MATRKPWTRDELLITLNLYQKLNFGQFDSRNHAVIDLSHKLGRTAGSVSMKLCNFASFDPILAMRGIKGLQGASRQDRQVWDEFHANPLEMAEQSEALFQALFETSNATPVEVIPTRGVVRRAPLTGQPTETIVLQKHRLGQEYFRQIVLNNFNNACGISGLPVRELLVASHIAPWSHKPIERLNVQNGLCLSRLHDAAFDQGLITFDEDLRLMISPKLKKHMPQRALDENFAAYENQPLQLSAESIPPSADLLAYHRREIFRD